MVKQNTNKWTIAKCLPWILVVGGLLGLIASFMLTIEKYDALQDPSYIPVCNLNPILNCGTVSSSKQSEAFGFYNPFLGLIGYSVVVTIGVALLAGAKFKRWFWQFTVAGLLFAVGFVVWLQFQTLYRIGALCIFCMVAWVGTIPIFWYSLVQALREGYIPLPAKLEKVFRFISGHHTDILLVWFLVIIALILKRFWYYWSSLI